MGSAQRIQTIPAVFAGLDKAEALPCVGQLFVAAQSGAVLLMLNAVQLIREFSASKHCRFCQKNDVMFAIWFEVRSVFSSRASIALLW